jgi:trehalose 6-phosphate synthase
MSRLVVVSNRVADLSAATQAGGLAVAVGDLLKRTGGVWFGWNGETVDDPTKVATSLTRSEGVTIATVPLSPEEYERYYLGYANSVLWPVFHNRLDLAHFEAGFFNAYHEVNQRFARRLKRLIKPDDVIWVHDYHLIPLGIELRRLGVDNPIGFFLHIPFPPGQCFLAIPEHRQLARAFAAFDMIGFQAKADVANFLDYLSRGEFGRVLQDGRLRIFDATVTAASFPISIDTAAFAALAASKKSRRQVTRLNARTGASRHIIGVDRLDYSKGLPERFRAFNRFLEKYADFRGVVSLTQVAPPTRESMEAYTEARRELEGLAGAINGRHGDFDWVPIRYIHRSVPRSSLAGIYRSSAVGLVTPLRDGMNLVAKEYVAAQDPADPGVLILSKFAGASEELKEALIINPYDIEQMADAIYQGLVMEKDARLARHGALLERITRHDIHAWASSFLATLDKAAASRRPASFAATAPAPKPNRSLQQMAQAATPALPTLGRPAHEGSD